MVNNATLRYMKGTHTTLGIIYLTLLASFLIAGSHIKVEYEFLSPLADNPDILEVEPVQAEEKNTIMLKVSHYWPPLGGVNCGRFENGECISRMANGQKFQLWVGVAAACPPELEFGTRIKVGDREWVCMDRGGMIKKDGEYYWIDMLTPYALYKYGEIVEGEIL